LSAGAGFGFSAGAGFGGSTGFSAGAGFVVSTGIASPIHLAPMPRRRSVCSPRSASSA
jgi:hypothetical protein